MRFAGFRPKRHAPDSEPTTDSFTEKPLSICYIYPTLPTSRPNRPQTFATRRTSSPSDASANKLLLLLRLPGCPLRLRIRDVKASMARVLSSRAAAVLARRLGAQPQPGVVLSRRHNHTRRPAAGVLEEDAAGPSAPAADASALSRPLEEAIDSAMARAAEPDWAPFRPGTSYFVPPRPAGVAQGILALIGHGGGHIGSSASPRRGLSTDEARAVVADSRGYPCSTYFIKGHFRYEVESPNTDANQAQEE
ncbi:uncharacterized protein [Miscanthus floridulus]|uniref:uncharacterized protein n=1 Tax=Miscanthus floridulus TaxID=154761 RepID=UPI0034575D1D